MEHTNGYQCQPSCCCTCHVNKMIRLACLIDISMLLQGGLERRGCVVGQKQSVAAEKCVLWKGLAICWRGGRGQKGRLNYEPLHTMTSVHQMGVCSQPHKGHQGENETFPLLVLITSITTSVTWHSGAVAIVGVPMSHQPLHSTELCCLHQSEAWHKPELRTARLVSMLTHSALAMDESHNGGRIHRVGNRGGVTSPSNSTLIWSEQWAPRVQYIFHYKTLTAQCVPIVTTVRHEQ